MYCKTHYNSSVTTCRRGALKSRTTRPAVAFIAWPHHTWAPEATINGDKRKEFMCGNACEHITIHIHIYMVCHVS